MNCDGCDGQLLKSEVEEAIRNTFYYVMGGRKTRKLCYNCKKKLKK